MGAEQALKPIVGSEGLGRTGSWLAGRSRAEARGYAIGLLALVVAAGLVLLVVPFVNATSALLLLLGSVILVLSLVAGTLISFLVSQLRTARTQAGPTTEAPGHSTGGEAAASNALELQAEIATLDRLGLTLAGHLDLRRLVKAVTDAGVAVTGAAFGAFLYRDASGVWTHCVSGAPPRPSSTSPCPRTPKPSGRHSRAPCRAATISRPTRALARTCPSSRCRPAFCPHEATSPRRCAPAPGTCSAASSSDTRTRGSSWRATSA